jgi:outer membrane protein OmpA-like peptidoglycan-associated protein
MKTRSLFLGAAASLALVGTANAATVNGWYIGLEGGVNWIDDVDVIAAADPDPPGPFPVPTTPGTFQFETGWAVLAAVGYGFGGHWRTELEGGYRQNDFATTGPVDTDIQEWSVMLNVLYDIHLTQAMTLSFGAGAGADFAEADAGPLGSADDWNFAYQGIAGLSYALSDRLDLTLNYRYFRVHEPEFVFTPVGATLSFAFDDVVKHTATIGLRYAFGVAALEPVMAPPPPPPPPPAEPAAPREFIVFFGHNRSDLTDEALGVVRQAADAAKKYGSATIAVVGHADRSGSAAHNQKLSLKRGDTVKGALVGEGIAAGAISVSGKGEGDPMVATADGVREPQNRRVHITL